MRAGLYARVSTFDKGQNPEVQLREMREYCERRHWEYIIFADPGWSGAKERRPQFDRMWQACRRRELDIVLVYRFDRFARSTRQLVNAMAEFEALGIQFVSLHESVDTTTPNGKLLFHIFAAIAEFERDLTRERVRSGLALARANGKKLGRPRCKVEPATLSLSCRLRSQGRPWSEIEQRTGVNRHTLRRLSKNPVS